MLDFVLFVEMIVVFGSCLCFDCWNLLLGWNRSVMDLAAVLIWWCWNQGTKLIYFSLTWFGFSYHAAHSSVSFLFRIELDTKSFLIYSGFKKRCYDIRVPDVLFGKQFHMFKQFGKQRNWIALIGTNTILFLQEPLLFIYLFFLVKEKKSN